MENVLSDTKRKLEKIMEVVMEDMEMVRVGGAKPSMVENIVVEAYGGQRMRLMELASITVPDPTQIVISPWDKGVVKEIVRTS